MDILKYLAAKASEQPNFFRRILGVQGVLDIMRTHYWFTFEENFLPSVSAYSSYKYITPAEAPQEAEERDENLSADDKRSHNQYKEHWQVLDDACISQIRRLFLGLINLFCENKFTEEEIRAFFMYVHGCSDLKQCIDITKFLLDIVSAKTPQHIIHTKILLKSGGVTPWLFVLKRNDHVLQDITLKIICHLLLASAETTEKSIIQSWVVALKHTLQSITLRLSVFRTLIGLFLGDVFSTSLLSSKDEPSKTSRKIIIRFPYILSVIFELLALSSPDLQGTILADFEYLFSALGKNLFAHISVKKWALCLLALIPSSPRKEKSENGNNDGSSKSDGDDNWSTVNNGQEIQSSVISLLSNLIVQRLITDSGAETCASIMEVFAVLRKVKEENRIAHCDIFLRMLGRATLDRLTDKGHALRCARGSKVITEAMLEWVCLTCLSVFSWDEHVLVLSDRYSDSTLWSLVHFAQCLLDFVDQLVPQREDSVVAAAAANVFPLQLQNSANSASATIMANLGKNPITTPMSGGGSGGGGKGDNSTRDGAMTSELRDAIILRLTLLVLYETHTMVHVRKLDRKKTEITRLDTLTKRSIETGPSPDAPSQSLNVLTKYLSQRMKYWNDELLTASKSFSACTQRFMAFVKKAVSELPPDEAYGKILIILSFLRNSIGNTASPERLEAIFVKIAQFGILLGCKSMNSPEELLKKGFSDADQRLLASMLEKEKEVIMACYEHLSNLGSIIFYESDEAFAAEFDMVTRVLGKATGILDKWAENEKKRIRIPNPKALEAFWRHFVFNSWPREVPHWKLDPAENSKRIRKRFSPNLVFDRHKDKVHSSNADDDSNNNNSIPNEIILSQGFEKGSSDADYKDEEEDEEDRNIVAGAEKEMAKSGNGKGVVMGSNDSKFFTYSAELIEPLHATPIEFVISSTWVRIIPAKGVDGYIDRVAKNNDLNEFTIPLANVTHVLMRRYVHIDSALEIFTVNHISYFVFFVNPRDRNRAYKRLGAMGAAEFGMLLRPLPLPEAFRKKAFTEAWVSRKISNFDYLMALNTYSGRSLNDISQYPVFPWIIADYESPVLDLTNPKTFRDLSVPMAVISPERAALARERYNALDDSESPIPRFHHGTHWLTPGAVLHYLIRVEPFTTRFLEFQGGLFDHVNRMFTSPGASYQGAYIDPSCTKELIPEFFYLPEMFVNSNHFNFGLPFGCPATPNKSGLVDPGVGDV